MKYAKSLKESSEFQGLMEIWRHMNVRNTLKNRAIYLKRYMDVLRLEKEVYPNRNKTWDVTLVEDEFAKPEYTTKEFDALFSRYWPEGATYPDWSGMLRFLSNRKKKEFK